jgi:hypothetical protein
MWQHDILFNGGEMINQCTNSDTYNCKYCNKAKSCEAMLNPETQIPPYYEMADCELGVILPKPNSHYPYILVVAAFILGLVYFNWGS